MNIGFLIVSIIFIAIAIGAWIMPGKRLSS